MRITEDERRRIEPLGKLFPITTLPTKAVSAKCYYQFDSWYNGCYPRKWAWWAMFIFWIRLFVFQCTLIPMGKYGSVSSQTAMGEQ